MRMLHLRTSGQELFAGCEDCAEVLGRELDGATPKFADYLGLLARCSLYVGTDSWPAHAAIKLPRTRFVLLKGAVSKRWDHEGRFSRIIRKSGCQACEGLPGGYEECFWKRERECMRSISVDEVEQASLEELEACCAGT